MIIAAIIFALLAFIATSTWTLFGSAIRNNMANTKVRQAVNTILALLLVYTAIDLLGWI